MSDYPTTKELNKIKNWNPNDFHGLMSFIKPLWTFEAWWKYGDIYIIATSGWSGNEEIIRTMRKNQMFWLLFWRESSSGGRHIFAPLAFEVMNKLDEIHPIIHPKEVNP